MKVECSKLDFGKMIRKCQDIRRNSCANCVFWDYCNDEGETPLEVFCEIIPDEQEESHAEKD